MLTITMKRLPSCLLIFCLAGTACAGRSSSEVLEAKRLHAEYVTSYSINNSWIDKNDLYILYAKITTVDHPEKFRFFNPHDSHTEYKKEIFYKKLKKNIPVNGEAINLREGISGDESMNPRDNLILLQKDGAILFKNAMYEIEVSCRDEICMVKIIRAQESY